MSPESHYARMMREKRRGPQPAKVIPVLPKTPETHIFEIVHDNECLEHSLKALTVASLRLLGSLGMPEQLKYTFAENNAFKGAATDPESLNIVAHRADSVNGHAFMFTSRVERSDLIVDEATYELWRPEREGYMLQWGIHVDSLSRTVYPHQRHKKLIENDCRLQAGAVLRSISSVYDAIVSDKYQHHLYTNEFAQDAQPLTED